MHINFDWSLNLGQIMIVLSLAAVGFRVDTWIRRFWIEHEILVRDYCERKHIDLSELPTRFGTKLKLRRKIE